MTGCPKRIKEPGDGTLYRLAVTTVTSVSANGSARAYTYDANGSMLSGPGRTVTWSEYNKPIRISDPVNSYVSDFAYGRQRARYKQVATQPDPQGGGSHTVTTLYVGGGFEQITKTSTPVTEYRHYIAAGGNVIAIHTAWDTGNTREEYLHRGHLGSVSAITTSAGTVLERFSYGPWGKRRNGSRCRS